MVLLIIAILLWVLGLIAFAIMSRKYTESWIVSIGGGFLFGLSLFMVLMAISTDKKENKSVEEGEQVKPSKYEPCNEPESAQCFYDRHFATITSRCQRAIESRTLYKHKWTDGLLDSKFSRAYWVMPNEVISVDGDKIQMQNGFGVMQNQIYQCWYNVQTKNIQRVIINPGRYPKY